MRRKKGIIGAVDSEFEDSRRCSNPFARDGLTLTKTGP